MQSNTCNYNVRLSLRWIARDFEQYAPLHLQNPKGPFDDISKRRMGIIEYLLFTSWFCGVLKVLNMVLRSLVRSKVTGTVWVPGVDQVELHYSTKCL
jgi:hypothetical protein